MKRIIVIFICLMTLNTGITRAQGGIVHDPLTLGVQSTEAAQTLSELIAILETVLGQSETLDKLKELNDKVYAVADKTNDVLTKMGYLEDIVMTYNDIIQTTQTYIDMLEYSDMPVSVIHNITQQLHRLIKQSTDIIEYLKILFERDDLTKDEQEQKVRAWLDSLIKINIASHKLVTQELKIQRDVQTLIEFDKTLVDAVDREAYISYRMKYGSITDQKFEIINLIKLLLGLLGIGCLVWSWILMVRGSASGDETSQMGFLRTGVALLAAAIIIVAIESVITTTGVL